MNSLKFVFFVKLQMDLKCPGLEMVFTRVKYKKKTPNKPRKLGSALRLAEQPN